MTLTHRIGDELAVEGLRLSELAARFGTPLYVYSRAELTAAWKRISDAFAAVPHQVFYAIKANSNLAILNIFGKLGAGFDIVSVGELERVLAAGGQANRVVFSGVGKRRDELERALAVGIQCFNVESGDELARLEAVAAGARKRAPIALRVNPDVDAKTHPYISTGLRENKFGVDFDTALVLYRRAAASPHLVVKGIGCHIGSQMTDTAPLIEAAGRVLAFADTLAREGIALSHIDLGGGFGIAYRDETAFDIGAFGREVARRFTGRRETLGLEPGRYLVGNAGLLLTRVEYLKRTPTKHFAIVDAGMNDLLRPALYEAWHAVQPVTFREGEGEHWDIVGPVCESADWLARDRLLRLEPGDLLALMSAGAYGAAMASNYNSRPRPAQVLVDGEHAHLIVEREQIADLWSHERIPQDI